MRARNMRPSGWLLLAVTLGLLTGGVAGASTEYSIATFNVQVFGQTKMSNPFVVNALVDMFRMYDIICMQEIRDASDSAFLQLLREINNRGDPHYDAHLTTPRGRSNSKEQEAYIWRSDEFHYIHAHAYKESNDEFEREPEMVLLEHLASGTQFTLLGIHITPQDVAVEMDALIDVYKQGSAALGSTSVLILGDMNAGCSYLSNSARESLKLWTDTDWVWFLPEGTDTTVATSSCPYDRLIATKEFEQLVVPGSAEVYRFDERLPGLSSLCAKHVSDHYPISLTLKIGATQYQVASFNVQVFGQTKMGKTEVADILVDIFRKYDVIVMQEVRDSSDTAFNDLVAAINAKGGDQYDSFLTVKHGRSNSKEQEGYVWKRDLFTKRDSFEYNDVGDVFEREPTPVLFRQKGGSGEFFLIGIHITPQDVATEMDALVDVWDEAVSQFGNEYGLILGDMNAGCSYLSNTARDQLKLKTDARFEWLLPEGEDTTVAKGDCPYDRFISSTKFKTYRYVTDSATVFRFDDPANTPNVPADCAEDISDHYPVSVNLAFPMPPSASPTNTPTVPPSTSPLLPSLPPSVSPTVGPSQSPANSPTNPPSAPPSESPSQSPSVAPSAGPTVSPQATPTVGPSPGPSTTPSAPPSASPQAAPTAGPTAAPEPAPTKHPLTPAAPTESPRFPTLSPSASPSKTPSASPQAAPTAGPTTSPSTPPSASPQAAPTAQPSAGPTASPEPAPTKHPLTPASPTESPRLPTLSPSASPSKTPSVSPEAAPTAGPTAGPTAAPSAAPQPPPTKHPLTPTAPTESPHAPTLPPSAPPSQPPSGSPLSPSKSPTTSPSASPSKAPEPAPTKHPLTPASPTESPRVPTVSPSGSPSRPPSASP
eukprot:Hpha_TRINITY_DN16660_c0_g1::TRINITY_DN16660_c0_g1_i1::g.181648::m.181648